MQFPVALFRGVEIAIDVNEHPVPIGFRLLAKKKLGLIDTVDCPIDWQPRARDLRHGREDIHDVHDFVAHPTGGNMAWPSDDEGRSDAPFERRVIVRAREHSD